MPSKPTVLILGSNSFSGASFAQHLLKNGYPLIATSRSEEPHDAFLPYKWDDYGTPYSVHQIDINHDRQRLMELIASERPAYCVNFASQSMVAESWEHPEHWYHTNGTSTVLLYEALRKQGILEKYVHISTPEVYGSCSGLVKEDHPYNPSTPYASSRAAGDMFLKNAHSQYGLPVVFTRAANIYGPGQQLYRIIPRTILCILAGEKLQLHGGGHSVRSFIHAEDVARATIQIAEKGQAPDIFHLSTKENISIRKLVEMICEKMDVPFEEVVEIAEERPGKDAAYLLDSQKARDELGWEPEISLEDGISQCVQWANEHLDALKKAPQQYIHKA